MNLHATSSIRLICFDVGGVLVDTCRTFVEGIAAAGLPFRSTPLEIETLYGSALDIRQQYRTGQIASDSYARGISSALNGLYSSDEVVQVRDASIKDTYPETETILYELNGFSGIQVALLTNTNLEQWSRVVVRPWVRYVDHAFASHELGIAKPSPEVFKAVETATQTLPSQILFFDDAEANIAVSSHLCWRSVLVDSSTNPGIQIRQELSQWGIAL